VFSPLAFRCYQSGLMSKMENYVLVDAAECSGRGGVGFLEATVRGRWHERTSPAWAAGCIESAPVDEQGEGIVPEPSSLSKDDN
jgi:hypothetical protein